MEWVQDFLFQNFILLFTAIVMFVSSIVRYKAHPRVSVYTMLIMIIALCLASFVQLEKYGKSIVDPTLTLIFSILGYIFRPICIYLFYLLGNEHPKKRWIVLSIIPLAINIIIYSLAFVPTIDEYIVYFDVVTVEGVEQVSFHGGFLRFTSHVVSLLYLLFLIYLSITTVKFKRLFRVLTTLTCVTIVVVAVVVESFFNSEGNINVLNTAIPFSILIYYLYLNIEKAELDNSTGFYNREVYNAKVDKINEIVKGVILFKIPLDNNPDNVDVYNKNNDDIKHISAIILHNISRKMIVYRLEDNMFFLVTNDSNTKTVLDIYDRIKKQLYEHSYKVDIGYAFRTSKNELIHELYLEADRMIRTAKGSFNGNTATMKKIF